MAGNSARRKEYGDWQTPLGLCEETLARVRRTGISPRTIVEPTCGKGAFLEAAAKAFPGIFLIGYEINPRYLQEARDRLGKIPASLIEADFFALDWERELGRLSAPFLILGNPPWVTSSELGSLGSENLPEKANFKRLSGLDARTGKSNFDVSEFMITRILSALRNREFMLAMLCKSAVARRVMEFCSRASLAVAGETCRIEAMTHFDAAVEAVLLQIRNQGIAGEPRPCRWPVFKNLQAETPDSVMGVVDGMVCPRVDAFLQTRWLSGDCRPEWRSGVKHDCARVMEFRCEGGTLVNSLGETADLEEEWVFPFLKGSDLANGRQLGERAVLITQKSLGEEVSLMRFRSPKTWSYLLKHRKLLEARKSSIYQNQPAFSIFGIGPYSFAPFKVATCGLYKRLHFRLIPPCGGKPVIVDDTCYFLPFDRQKEAETALKALTSDPAREFFEARVFWDAKRPINKGVLQSLNLERLCAELGLDLMGDAPSSPRQQSFSF